MCLFHLLKDVPDLACGEPADGNVIVERDTLVALEALLGCFFVHRSRYPLRLVRKRENLGDIKMATNP